MNQLPLSFSKLIISGSPNPYHETAGQKQEIGGYVTNENGYKIIYYYRYCDYSLEKGVVVRGSKP
jgi:hypothetical protein